MEEGGGGGRVEESIDDLCDHGSCIDESSPIQCLVLYVYSIYRQLLRAVH